jgi:threonine/homoserine/homoserine lactone efflux protein
VTIVNFFFFCGTNFVSVASPGPGSLVLIARVLSQGSKGISSFIAGFVMGDLVWFVCAATGLALIAQMFYGVFLAIKYAGAVYLLYLAYRLWNAPTQQSEISALKTNESSLQRFLSGFAITLGNPIVMVFYLALLPTVVNLEKLNVVECLQIAIAIASIRSVVFATYALTADRARHRQALGGAGICGYSSYPFAPL